MHLYRHCVVPLLSIAPACCSLHSTAKIKLSIPCAGTLSRLHGSGDKTVWLAGTQPLQTAPRAACGVACTRDTIHRKRTAMALHVV